MKKFYSIILSAFAALTLSAQTTSPILNPQGECTLNKVDRSGFIVFWGEVAPDGNPASSKVIYGENNEVYFKIVPKSEHNGYVKGVKEGDKIKVQLPQSVGFIIDEWTGEETEVFADVLDYIEIDGYQWYVNSGETSVLEFDVAEDGSFSFDFAEEQSYFPKKMIGIVSDLDPESFSWTGFGDWYERYSVVTDTPIALPDGVESETWTLFHEYESRNVEVAISGNDIYLGNLSDDLPDSYVKGTIDGEKVTFPITYMGYSETAGSLIYFVPCYWEEVYVEAWDELTEDYVIRDTWTFDYDAENKRLSNIEDFAALMLGTSDKVGELAGSYIEMFFEPSIMWLDPALADDPLANPEFLNAYRDDWFGCDFVEFFIPSANQSGYPLNTERLSYVFYLDGEPFTFTTDDYIGLEEEMTEIPFDFCDWENEDIWSYGQEHQLCLYNKQYATVGLKVFYEKEDGTVVESEYVEANIEELSEGSITGIQNITSEKNVRYFDAQGRAISQPQRGLNIKISNGKAKKIIF